MFQRNVGRGLRLLLVRPLCRRLKPSRGPVSSLAVGEAPRASPAFHTSTAACPGVPRLAACVPHTARATKQKSTSLYHYSRSRAVPLRIQQVHAVLAALPYLVRGLLLINQSFRAAQEAADGFRDEGDGCRLRREGEEAYQAGHRLLRRASTACGDGNCLASARAVQKSFRPGARRTAAFAAMTVTCCCGLSARLAAMSAQKATASCEPKSGIS